MKSIPACLVILVLCSAGCAAQRQSAGELNAVLAWFVTPDHAEGWPPATTDRQRLAREPIVVIAWSPAPSPDAATRAVREGWIAAIKEKLDRSGLAARTEGSAPDTFEGGVTAPRLQSLAEERRADVVVLFGIETATRRYQTAAPTPGIVSSVVEVVAQARAVGVTPSGVPLFADTQKGFAASDVQKRTVEELETTSKRVAVDALADAIVRRLKHVSADPGSP